MEFCKIKNSYLAIHAVEISGMFSTSSQTNVLQDPMVTNVQKRFLFQNLVLVLEIVVLEHFW